MKKIYILLMQTNTIPARIIRFFTRYTYSHVAISFDKNCDITYSFGRKELKHPLNGGFIKEKKNGEFFEYFNKTKCKIYEVSVTDKEYTDAITIIENMEKNMDTYKYDFYGMIFRFFNIPKTYENKYVCSYFVASVLEKANIYKFKKDICLVEPKDFEELNECSNVKEIYKGKYSLFNHI